MKRNIPISLAFGMLSAFFTCIASEENGKGTSNQDISADSHAMDIPYTVEEINSDHYILRKKDSDMKVDIGNYHEQPFLTRSRNYFLLIIPGRKGFNGYIVQENKGVVHLIRFSDQIFGFFLDQGRQIVHSLLKKDFDPDSLVFTYFSYVQKSISTGHNQITAQCLYCLPSTDGKELWEIYWDITFLIEKQGAKFVLKPVKYEINSQLSDVQ